MAEIRYLWNLCAKHLKQNRGLLLFTAWRLRCLTLSQDKEAADQMQFNLIGDAKRDIVSSVRIKALQLGYMTPLTPTEIAPY